MAWSRGNVRCRNSLRTEGRVFVVTRSKEVLHGSPFHEARLPPPSVCRRGRGKVTSSPPPCAHRSSGSRPDRRARKEDSARSGRRTGQTRPAGGTQRKEQHQESASDFGPESWLPRASPALSLVGECFGLSASASVGASPFASMDWAINGRTSARQLPLSKLPPPRLSSSAAAVHALCNEPSGSCSLAFVTKGSDRWVVVGTLPGRCDASVQGLDTYCVLRHIHDQFGGALFLNVP